MQTDVYKNTTYMEQCIFNTFNCRITKVFEFIIIITYYLYLFDEMNMQFKRTSYLVKKFRNTIRKQFNRKVPYYTYEIPVR